MPTAPRAGRETPDDGRSLPLTIVTNSACALCAQPMHPGHGWALPESALLHIACGIHSNGITKDPDAFTKESIGPRQERERAQRGAGSRSADDDTRRLRQSRGRVGTAAATLLLGDDPSSRLPDPSVQEDGHGARHRAR